MKCTKNVRKILTLEDPKHIYSGSVDASLLKLVNLNWSRKCMNGVYILSIDKILQRSECEVNNRSLDGNCSVSVEMEVSVLYYEKSDLVIGKVVAIYPEGDIVLTNEYASIILGTSQATSSIKMGDNIPLYVTDSRYPLGKPKLSIIGVPFVPLFIDDIYLLEESANEMDFDRLFSTVNEKEAEVKLLEKSKTKVAAHFKTLLYPYNKTMTVKNSKSLVDITKATGYISRPSQLYGMPKFVAIGDYEAANAILMDRNIVIEKIVSSYIKELDRLILLIDTYDEPDIKNLSHIWGIYNRYKR